MVRIAALFTAGAVDMKPPLHAQPLLAPELQLSGCTFPGVP